MIQFTSEIQENIDILRLMLWEVAVKTGGRAEVRYNLKRQVGFYISWPDLKYTIGFAIELCRLDDLVYMKQILDNYPKFCENTYYCRGDRDCIEFY